MVQSYQDVLDALEAAQNDYELSIIRISEPISSALHEASGTRTSDVSAEGLNLLTPASLESDLSHYKELFSKLRFSYLEQVTKEKFIRSIVGEPPLVVEHQENVQLEAQLAVVKASLKAQKTQVDDMVAELNRQGRELSQKYETIQLQTAQLRELPERIENLRASIVELRAAQSPGANPNLAFGIEKTIALAEKKELERAELDRQLEQLRVMVPRKTRELERLENELQPLEVRRLGTTSAAREAKRRKEEALGGVGDDLEERGRWWRGVESGLREMLGVET